MNSLAKAALIATFAATVQLTAQTGHAQGALTINCAAPHRPSQQVIAEVLDLHNFGQVYDARDKLMRYVHRACLNGAGQVFVSNDSPVSGEPGWTYAGRKVARIAHRIVPAEQP